MSRTPTLGALSVGTSEEWPSKVTSVVLKNCFFPKQLFHGLRLQQKG